MNIAKKIVRNGFLMIALFGVQSFLLAARVLVDEIVVRVNDVNICKSDLEERQMQLGGNVRSKEQCIREELFYQKARSYGAIMSDSDAEKRLVSLREGYGFGYSSQGDFELFLRKAGLSTKRLLQQIKRTGSIASIENALAPKNALVSREDVEAYCLKNPLEKGVAYLLSFATVSANCLDSSGKLPDDVRLSWVELDGWMPESDLSAGMKFVAQMRVGDVSAPVVKDSICFLYRLEDKSEKRLLSVDERYAEVEQHLLKASKAQKEIEVRQRLRDEASVVFLS